MHRDITITRREHESVMHLVTVESQNDIAAPNFDDEEFINAGEFPEFNEDVDIEN